MIYHPADWIPTRAAARAALEAFVPQAGSAYARGRNTDPGPGKPTAVSGLSPWIRVRALSEAEVVRAVLEQHRLHAAEKFIQEVCWRTYWKGWLELRPAVWNNYRTALAEDRNRVDACALEAAEAGRTGIEVFDAYARQLVETGYVHNHARMWMASIWIFTLELPWTLGADFFLRHLLDGDPASNTLGWRWVAGLQTQGKHYLARASNIQRYTEGRFSPGGQLREDAEPLEGPAHPPRRELIPRPAAVEGRVGVVLGEDDVSAAEWIGAGGADIGGVTALFPAGGYREMGIAEPVRRFRRELLGEAVANACAESEPGELIEEEHPWEALASWAAARGLDHLVMAEPPVGWWDAIREQAESRMREAGLRWTWLRRPWDQLLFPHATHGFFRFKKKIPEAAVAAQSGLA